MPQQPDTSFDDDLKATRAGFESDLKTVRDHVESGKDVPHPIVARLLDWLPAAGGVVGGLIGAAAGAPAAGVGALPGGVAGATLGGATGEAWRQLGNRFLGNDAPTSAGEAATAIGRQGANQGIADLAGAGIGKAVTLAAKPVAGMLKRGATDTMIAALGPAGRGTGPAGRESLEAAKQIAPRLLKENFVAGSHAGALAKVSDKLDKANQIVDDIMSYGVGPNTKVPTQKIINSLQQAKASGQVAGQDFGTGEVANALIDHVVQRLKAMGPTITPADAVKLRQLTGPLAKWSALATAPEQVAAKTQQTIYNGIRSAIEDLHPSIHAANQDIHFWMKAQSILEKASQRPQAPSSGTGGAVIGAISQAAHGGSTGGVLGAAAIGRYMQRAMRSPGWRFVSANVKDDLAQALTNNDMSQIARITAKIAAASATPTTREDQ